MRVQIRTRHPIASNPNTPDGSDAFDGVTHTFDGDIRSVDEVCAFMERRTGWKMDRRPTHSRLTATGVVVCFPVRRKSGIHCLWLEAAPL